MNMPNVYGFLYNFCDLVESLFSKCYLSLTAIFLRIAFICSRYNSILEDLTIPDGSTNQKDSTMILIRIDNR